MSRFLYMPDTPITDLLFTVTGGETLATWNRHRGHLGMDGLRHPGGEWDTLRYLPLRVRRSLTAAGYLSRGGMMPDDFSDLLRRWGESTVEPDPIDWYVRTARKAIRESSHARRVARERYLAARTGHATHFAYRNTQAVTEGHASYWHKRKARGWT